MNMVSGVCLLLFVSVLCFALIILATEYWGWHE